MVDHDRAFSYLSEIRPAFLGHLASRLDTLIGRQTKAMLIHAGAQTPGRSVSVMLFLLKHGEASIADMARRDGQSHQLVASRIGPLEKLGLLAVSVDPDDERRKLCRLTSDGRADAKIVERVSREVARTLSTLNQELGFDLMDAIELAEKSLSRIPLYER
ncbi:DNA-binding MarR family transcriptional regulator [Parasphingopyxis lamellibrachiae]|uniref:DNA-binding MarR family transcriptional regulator n=2 Tax=Parasphingopyxis lamellibrachiae TaxID=680125 RepID=A0A3D9FGG1_9SPHN|nr:DNA-binding MarR family transcriptional regulator [Parasphingopyxis lamellibrachiae]